MARLGGDEFAVLLEGIHDPALALAVSERVVTALAEPTEIAHIGVHVRASVGLALRHPDSDPESLMRQADVAMYAAKARGKNQVTCFDDLQSRNPLGV